MADNKTIAILTCGLALLAASAAMGDGPALKVVAVGEAAVLDTGDSSNIGGLSAAYNSIDNEYRVAWYDSRITGQNDVYAQRLSADGGLLGDNVTIIAGTPSQTATAIAHNPVDNRYLVTWKYQNGGPGSEGFNHTFGAIASATGGLIGADADLCNGGLERTLVYNSVDNTYFFEARNFAGGGSSGIWGRRIASDGSAIGSQLVIATSGAPAPAGQVAHNTNANQYLATWRDQTYSDLKGRIINADGTYATSPFQISPVFPSSGLAASVAFDPVNDRYFVVFAQFSGGPVYGQFVSPAGDPDGATFTIFDSSATLFCFVDLDPITRTFLVAWLDNGTGKLAAQLLDEDGGLIGGPISIENPGSGSGTPRVTANSVEGGFLVAWIDHSWNPPEHHDAMAQIIGVFCTADINCDGVVDIDDVFAVLAAWGTCDDPDDCPADVNGDGVVDIDDVFGVLAAWGECP